MRAEVSCEATIRKQKKQHRTSSINQPIPNLLVLVVVLLLAVVVVVPLLHVGTLLAVHSGLNLLKLALASKKLLPLLVDFALHLDLDLSQLLLFSAKLLLLQSDGLGSQVLWVHRSITMHVSLGSTSRTREYVRSTATINALAELLCAPVLVEEIMGDLLQIGQMAVQQSAADSQEIGVPWVIDLNHSPWILAGSDFASTDLNGLLGSDNREWHESAQLGVLLNGVLIILLDIIWEVVDWNAVVLDILHDELLRFCELSWCERVGLSDDWDDVASWRQALHELDIKFAETRHH